MSNKKRVAVALSGGLDSSVVCRLLLSQGYNVVAVTAKMIDDENFSQIAEKAGAVADKLEIPHYIIDLSKDFKLKKKFVRVSVIFLLVLFPFSRMPFSMSGRIIFS